MKDTLTPAFTAMLMFFGQLLLETVQNSYLGPNGWYVIGPSLSEGGVERKQLDIYNVSDAMINDLYISAPKGTSISDVYTPSALRLEAKNNALAESRALFSVSLIQSGQISRVFFDIGVNDNFEVINARDLGLKQMNSVFNPFKRTMISIVLHAFALSVVLFLVTNIFELRNKAARAKQKEFDDKTTADNQKIIQNLEGKWSVLRDDLQSSRKNNIILVARIREYAKELDFWRDTIRKILYGLGEEKIDRIMRNIVNNLKTYSTLRKQDDFNYISLMAQQLKNHESVMEHDASAKKK